MANLGFVNILAWPPDQVANWLKGLSAIIQPYISRFVSAGIDGSRLLTITHSDLSELGIKKLGHQELILEAVDLLIQLHYELETTNLQSLALATSCRSRSLYCSLKSTQNGSAAPDKVESLSISQLTLVTQLVVISKKLTNWLDRPPFDVWKHYITMRNELVEHATKIIENAIFPMQPSHRQSIEEKCLKICELCENLIQNSKDSLIIQPAQLELATIRKKPDEELGLNIQSVHGVHVIGIVKSQSPAQQCGRVEEGDEVVQVNYETVVGWELSSLVVALKENQREVTLTLKKRPRHVQIETCKRNRRKVTDAPGTFPKSSRKSHHGSKKKGHEELQTLLVPPQFEESVKAETDDEAESETAVKRRESIILNVDPEPARQRRATVSGSAARNSLRAKQVLVLQQQEGRPKSCVVSSSETETTHRSLPTSSLSSPDHTIGAAVPTATVTSGGSSKVMPLTPGVELRLGKLFTSGRHQSVDSSLQTDVFAAVRRDDIAASYRNIATNSASSCSRVPSQPDGEASSLTADDSKQQKLLPVVSEASTDNQDELLEDKFLPVAVANSEACLSLASHPSDDFLTNGAALNSINDSDALTPPRFNSSSSVATVMDSPAKLSQQQSTPIIPGVSYDKNTPRLVGITPVNSTKRAQQWGQTRPEENTGDGTAQQKSSQYLQPDSSSHQSARHRLSPGSRRKERSSPATTSNETSSTAKKAPSGSQTNLAVIVTHKYEKQQSSNSPKTTPVLLRKKLHGSTVRLLGEKRRISCKDLGHGDCQGYLYKLKTGVFSRWVKKFCVVKDYHLYLYDTKEDDRAQGIIDLRAFKVSPATENEAKQKKFAFKVYHSGTTFIFASETLEDMRKWMEKMGMSAIGYDMSNVPTLAGFSTQTINEEAAAAYSESDDEETSNHYNDKAEELKSQLQSDPLTAAYSQLRKAAVDFSGTDLKIKRTQTMMQTVRLKSAKNVSTKSKRQVELTLKLGGLERTLKDKEGELQLIEDLLSNKMITGEEIKRLMAKNPRIDKRSKPSKDSNSSSDEDL